jgi:hypothetical protein
VGGGEDEEGTPPYDWPDDGEPSGKGKRPKAFLEHLKGTGGRYCKLTDFPGTDPSRLEKAEKRLREKGNKEC